MSKIILLDGPVGTELNARGVPTPLPYWSAAAAKQSADVLAGIHHDYAVAGSTIHTANTFRTRRRSVGDRWREWTNRSVQVARAAIDPSHQLAGSLAPVADCYRPDWSPGQAAFGEHLEMAFALSEAGCDLILCETFANGDEAVSAVSAASQTNLPVWIALTAGPVGDLMSPRQMTETAKQCVESGATAVLINCTRATATATFVQAMSDALINTPIGAYANAGDADDQMGWRDTALPIADTDDDRNREASRYLERAKEWVNRGATILGGCCGTGPAHIRAISKWFARENC